MHSKRLCVSLQRMWTWAIVQGMDRLHNSCHCDVGQILTVMLCDPKGVDVKSCLLTELCQLSLAPRIKHGNL